MQGGRKEGKKEGREEEKSLRHLTNDKWKCGGTLHTKKAENDGKNEHI